MPRNPECALCPLGDYATTRCVWGQVRNPQPETATVMIVGEAPGYQEDQHGAPFIGPSGLLLADALRAGGLTQSYYVTNVVKCRAEGQPKPASVKACRPYLQEELETVTPRYILALGNTAWHWFGSGPITEQAGKEIWSEKWQAHIMPALHPAAILRDPNRRKAWEGDIYRFCRLVEGTLIEKPDVKVNLVESDRHLDALTSVLLMAMRSGTPVTFDFETSMLEWWHRDFKALTLALSWSGTSAFVVPLDHPQSPVSQARWQQFFQDIKPEMTSPKSSKTMHNQLFDDLVWYRVAGYLPYTTCDTMVLAHILDENRPKSLKWLGRALLGWPDWGIDTRNLADQPLTEVAHYNGLDAAATWLMRTQLLAELAQEPRLLRYFRSVEMPKLRALERMMARGVFVDYPAVTERKALAIQNSITAAQQIPVENPGSNPQIAAWLYDEQKLPIYKYTPGGEPSTDMETIKRLAVAFPAARQVLEYRKWKKFQTTYFEPLEMALRASFDRRYHPDYRSASVETGRLGSSFHTTPRDSFVRSVFTAPAGHCLVQFDMKQVEARLAAWKAAGSPTSPSAGAANGRMLQAFLGSRDVYVETAAYILNKRPTDVTKEERQIMGKVPVLAMLYRISPKGLLEYAWKQWEIVWTPAQAQQVWRKFYEMWPEFRLWHEREEKIILSRGYSQSPIGRLRRLPAAFYESRMLQAEAVNAGINQPIQSVASDLTQVSMVLIDREMPTTRIVGNVHDALLFELPTVQLDTSIPRIERIMTQSHKALRPLGLHLPDGLVQVDISIGAWGTGVPLDTYRAAM